MSAPTINLDWKVLILIIPAGGILYVAYMVYKFKHDPTAFQSFATAHPNLASLFISAGVTAPGGQVPDVTGAAGAQSSIAAMNSTIYTSQGYYGACLQQTAYDNGFDTSLAEQGTSQWPYNSYSDWVSAGYPALPGADKITVDAAGDISNEYTP